MKMKGCKQASNEANLKQKKNVQNRVRLECFYFYYELRLGNVLKMFLFFGNLSLNVLINILLTKKKISVSIWPNPGFGVSQFLMVD